MKTLRTDSVVRKEYFSLVGEVENVPAILSSQLETEVQDLEQKVKELEARIKELEQQLKGKDNH